MKVKSEIFAGTIFSKVGLIVAGLFLIGLIIFLGDIGFGSSKTSDSKSVRPIRITGSSTIFPFATSVSERLNSALPGQPSAIIESIGSSAGIRMFCGGLGSNSPDIATSSRPMTIGEVKLCDQNGVGEIDEIKIGLDGIVFTYSNNVDDFPLKFSQIHQAIARFNLNQGKLEENRFQRWDEIDSALPPIPISIIGPADTSASRSIIEERMDAVCQYNLDGSNRILVNAGTYMENCHEIRSDGIYINASENDNLTIRKIENSPGVIGVFGWGYLENNVDRIVGISIDGVRPSRDSIATGQYPFGRPMYLYVKCKNLELVPGLKEYIRMFVADDASGSNGYLIDRGLIPLSYQERAKSKRRAQNLCQHPTSPKSDAD